MNLNFIVEANSIKQEVDLIWDKILNYNFFIEHNYTLTLPQHKIVPKLIEKSLSGKLSHIDYTELYRVIEFEVYNKLDYQNGINKIKSRLLINKINFSILKEYEKQWQYKLFNEYHIKLTLYGPGGEYRPSTGTIIMLTTKDGEFRRGQNPLDTIIHEMIHIGIEESIIQKFDITHIVKEQIVDLFVKFHFSEILPNYLMQNLGRNTIKNYLTSKEDWNNINDVIVRYKDNEQSA